jgi:two-component system NtrC family sensor kinase
MSQHPYAAMRRMILAMMILVPAIPFVLVLGIGYYYFTTSLETSTISSMKRIVGDHRQMIESFLAERKANLEFIIYSYSYENLADPETLFGVFNRLQMESSAFVDLGIFNEDGIHVNYQGPYRSRLVGRDYGEEDWFKHVIKQGFYISDVFLGYRKVPHFIIAIAREEKKSKWVIRATIDTYMFNELVKKVRIGKTGEAYILNAEGLFQTERRSGGDLMKKDPDYTLEATPHEGIKTFISRHQDGDAYLYASTWLKNKGWLLVVRQEKADAFSALRSATYLIVLIVVVGGAVITVVAFYTTNYIVRRMEFVDKEKDQLGEQLIRASRLAELGEMAAGFAHEINNPLQIMRSEQTLMETILSDLKEKGELKESGDLAEFEDSMDQIKLQIDRCAKITQAILKFGRQGEPISRDMDLSVFIPEVAAMVDKRASVHGIVLKEEIAEEISPVHGDPGQLQQVLLNLLNNAIDAIIEAHGSKGGELVIQAKPDENGKVVISVTDNGAGISPENLKKVFTPFFTTKPVGKGTGLGLSVCYGIVDNMGGVMEVESKKGVGTTFTVRLPGAD